MTPEGVPAFEAAVYADLAAYEGTDPEAVAKRWGISWERLMRICGASDAGHSMEAQDAGDGVWFQSYGRACTLCGAPDDDYED